MNERQLATRVVIEDRALRGSGHDDLLQTVATVYVEGAEYRVLAPPKAVGDALQWLDHLSVRQASAGSGGSETEVVGTYRVLALKLLEEELDRLRREENRSANEDQKKPYYHVRLQASGDAEIEVKFDLGRDELEERILGPYRNLQPIVLGGRTFAVQDLKRVEVFETVRSSSHFGEWIPTLARQGADEWLYGEPDARNVTDEFIKTPSLPVLPQKNDAIELLCSRFHVVCRQLRERHGRGPRPTLDVADEYDVQDLLHALLRIFFDDVRPEEWTPSYAGKSSRMDFLLPAQESVIEAKKARQGLGAKELGSELIEDIARYRVHPTCKRLICFVYDPEGRVANPRGIEKDLSRKESDFEVKVIISPT